MTDQGKISEGRAMLEQQGHTVERIVFGHQTVYRVDGGPTVTPKELCEYADGVFRSWEELLEVLTLRRAEEDPHTP